MLFSYLTLIRAVMICYINYNILSITMHNQSLDNFSSFLRFSSPIYLKQTSELDNISISILSL